jgi:hypothetical protein
MSPSAFFSIGNRQSQIGNHLFVFVYVDIFSVDDVVVAGIT